VQQTHQVPAVAPHEPITALLDRLTPTTGGRALAVDDWRVVGIITARDITRLIDVHQLASQG
jgi:CBS domain-containing protein